MLQKYQTVLLIYHYPTHFSISIFYVFLDVFILGSLLSLLIIEKQTTQHRIRFNGILSMYTLSLYYGEPTFN
jgi:hypothetical protein